MKIVEDYPPNYEEICKHFKIRNNKYVVFTYGDTLYNPGGGHIAEDLKAHEQVHMQQQQTLGASQWWQIYLADPKFRLVQEVQAYRRQYNFSKIYPRSNRRKLLRSISQDLSGPMYGNIVNYQTAKDLIENRRALDD
jgi:hypothetical protein